MSISAQNSEFSFAVQPAFVGTGTYTVGTYSYQKVQAPRVATTIVEDVQNLPLRLGGPLTIDGLFKQGVMFGGDFDLIMSVEGAFGHLLRAASTTYAVAADGVNIGAYDHTFKFDDDNANLPWLTARVKIPQDSGYYAETGYDCRIAGMSFNIGNQGLVTANVQLSGRDFVIGDGSGWTYANSAFESPNSHFNATQLAVTIGADTWPLLAATVEFANGLSGPREETLIGSPKMKDITVRQKSCTVRLVLQISDFDVRRQILTGSAAGTAWTSAVFETVTAANKAFKIAGTSAAMIGSTPDVAQQFTLEADQVSWRLGRPLELAGGELLAMEVIGVCATPTNPAHDYFRATIKNDVATYA